MPEGGSSYTQGTGRGSDTAASEEAADLLQKLGHAQAELLEQALGSAAFWRPQAVEPELPCRVACAAVELPERFTHSLS